jgi:adenylate kinase family enzyme
MPTVILLIGPSGSGKTSMGKRIAQNKGWAHISEDKIWDKINHVPYTYRTPKEQAVIQPLSIKHIMQKVKKRKNVVFEFLVFDNPPTPIVWYQAQLSKRNVKVITRVFRPTLNELLLHQKTRGREKNIQKQRKHAKHQLTCLRSRMIKKEWIINPSGKTLEENYNKYFEPIILSALSGR